jgi:hypothetical protein
MEREFAGSDVRLGPVRLLPLQRVEFWADGVVPFAVEVMAVKIDCLDFRVRDLDSGRIGILIEFATDLETGTGRGRCDELDLGWRSTGLALGTLSLAAPAGTSRRARGFFGIVPGHWPSGQAGAVANSV